ncbi:MAG: hypothetical protein ACLFNW_03860 [Desulfobacterales bacterium]
MSCIKNIIAEEHLRLKSLSRKYSGKTVSLEQDSLTRAGGQG